MNVRTLFARIVVGCILVSGILLSQTSVFASEVSPSDKEIPVGVMLPRLPGMGSD